MRLAIVNDELLVLRQENADLRLTRAVGHLSKKPHYGETEAHEMARLREENAKFHAKPLRKPNAITVHLPEPMYRQCRAAAEWKPLGEWLRDVIGTHLAATTMDDLLAANEVLLAEVLVLRTVLLNFHRAAVAGEPLTVAAANDHVKAAEDNKRARAKALLEKARNEKGGQ